MEGRRKKQERKIKRFWQLRIDLWVMKGEGIEKEEGIRQKKEVALRKEKGLLSKNWRKQQQNESKHIIFSTFFAILDTGKQNKAVVEQRYRDSRS